MVNLRVRYDNGIRLTNETDAIDYTTPSVEAESRYVFNG